MVVHGLEEVVTDRLVTHDQRLVVRRRLVRKEPASTRGIALWENSADDGRLVLEEVELVTHEVAPSVRKEPASATHLEAAMVFREKPAGMFPYAL